VIGYAIGFPFMHVIRRANDQLRLQGMPSRVGAAWLGDKRAHRA
jgi:hypothetical protein